MCQSEKLLNLAIKEDSDNRMDIPNMNRRFQRNYIDAWMFGNDLLLREMDDCLFEDEIQTVERLTVERILNLPLERRTGLRPYHAELVNRVQLRNLRLQNRHNGSILDSPMP